MAKRPTLTGYEYSVIKRHNDRLIEGAEMAIMQLRATPAKDRSYMAKNMLLYWLDVVKALKWSTQIAAQKAGVAINDGSHV